MTTGALLLAGCSQLPEQQPTVTNGPATNAAATKALVDRVVDGDTLIVIENGQRLRIRLVGIDAPESVRPGAPVECYGPEASEFLKQTLPAQSTVQLETDPIAGDKDKYGRLLRSVFTADGTNVAVSVAAAGMGREYIYAHKPSRYGPEISAAQGKAQQAKTGLWGAC